MDGYKSFKFFQFLFPDAVLITGSSFALLSYDTAELYQPASGVSCALPKLPGGQDGHTVESSGLLCGEMDTCLQWSPDTGTWEDLMLTLDFRRFLHVSWTPGTEVGTYLMGGTYSRRTTTLIKPDGSHEPGFDLNYDT